MVLITYDVDSISKTGQKRLRQVAKICTNYGQRVQNSVFECRVTEVQYILLKSLIKDVIDNELDSVRFYLLGNNWINRIDTLGKKPLINLDDELII